MSYKIKDQANFHSCQIADFYTLESVKQCISVLRDIDYYAADSRVKGREHFNMMLQSGIPGSKLINERMRFPSNNAYLSSYDTDLRQIVDTFILVLTYRGPSNKAEDTSHSKESFVKARWDLESLLLNPNHYYIRSTVENMFDLVWSDHKAILNSEILAANQKV
ncbi:hypothetical protein BDF14DRAFT_1799512, partial [Spinellus fusiger]